MKTIRFKSIPENYRKESLGLKRNTIRKKDNDVRFEILYDFEFGTLNEVNIEIENTETKEVFSRKVTDVTKFEDFYIISWS